MIIRCGGCGAIMASKGFEKGDQCLSCMEPLNLKECMVVEEMTAMRFMHMKG